MTLNLNILKVLSFNSKARDYQAHAKPNAPGYNTINTCIIGAYKSNVNSKYLNERTYIAPVPHQFLENVRESNVVNLQLNKIDSSIARDLAALETSKSPSMSSASNSPLTFAPKTLSMSNLNAISTGFTDINHTQPNDKAKSSRLDRLEHSSDSSVGSSIGARESLQNKLPPPPNMFNSFEDDLNKSSRPGTAVSSSRKKEVSFNKDIDVRIYKINKQNDQSKVSLVEQNPFSIPPIDPVAPSEKAKNEEPFDGKL